VEPSGSLEDVGEEVRKAAESFNATILLKAPVDIISDGRGLNTIRLGGLP
jgi:NAD(P)H-hydrate repair Nnr-like enzyme with NAD(P)H-hydrate dehydratase domain